MDTATLLVCAGVALGFPLLASSQERGGISLEKAAASEVVMVPIGSADAAYSVFDKARSESEVKILDNTYETSVNSEKSGIKKLSDELSNRRQNLLILLQILRGAR